MKSNRILAIAVLSLFAAAGAQAETYDGVHPLTHSASRAEVKTQAVVAAHSADPYADGFDAGAPAPIVSEVARNEVKADAVVAAHSADPPYFTTTNGRCREYPKILSERPQAITATRARPSAIRFLMYRISLPSSLLIRLASWHRHKSLFDNV